MTPHLIDYPDREMMMIDLANRLAGELNMALMTKGHAVMAVPGGSTPGPIFDALCAADLPWDKVTVLLTDERQVPEDAPRSNARLLRDRLLTGPAAAARFLPFAGRAPDALSAELAPLLPLDLLLLGMGADMHTASLFPGAPELAAALDPHAPPVLALTPPDGLEPRLSLTGPVLAHAITSHIVITGAEKRQALTRAAKEQDPMLAPVRVVMQDATIHWAA